MCVCTAGTEGMFNVPDNKGKTGANMSYVIEHCGMLVIFCVGIGRHCIWILDSGYWILEFEN